MPLRMTEGQVWAIERAPVRLVLLRCRQKKISKEGLRMGRPIKIGRAKFGPRRKKHQAVRYGIGRRMTRRRQFSPQCLLSMSPEENKNVMGREKCACFFVLGECRTGRWACVHSRSRRKKIRRSVAVCLAHQDVLRSLAQHGWKPLRCSCLALRGGGGWGTHSLNRWVVQRAEVLAPLGRA
jgi:hypothetical protein